MAYVAGLEVAIVRQRILRAFGVVEVTFEYVGPFQPELACLANGQLLCVRGHVFGCHVRNKPADGTDGRVPVLPRLGVSCWTRFAEAVALLDGDFEPSVCRVDEFASQWRGAGVHHA